MRGEPHYGIEVVAVGSSDVHVQNSCDTLSYFCECSMSGANDDTDFATAPRCQLGHVMRDDILQILYLRRKYDGRARIVLSNMDVKDTFRQVPVEWARSPMYSVTWS